jgi:hypothetical protein
MNVGYFGILKVYTGSIWTKAKLKTYLGGSWQLKKLMRWDNGDSTWKEVDASG